MVVKKEKTKRGVFFLELGSTKRNAKSESIEEFYRRTIPGSTKAEQTYNMFIEYYLSNGYKEKELRLDRTAIQFCRRKN